MDFIEKSLLRGGFRLKLLLENGQELAGKYSENWKNHAGHSEVYTGKTR